MSRKLEIKEFNLGEVLDEVERVGAASRHLLPDVTRVSLLEDLQEVSNYSYFGSDLRDSRAIIVTTSMWIHTPNKRLNQFLLDFQQLLDQQLGDINPYPFSTQLELDPLLIGYRAGSPGLKPHTDNHEVNLFCNLVIKGRGRFFVCSDKDGNNAVEIDDSPGRAVFMGAPGFRTVTEPQYHLVSGIQEERYVLSLRQYRRFKLAFHL